MTILVGVILMALSAASFSALRYRSPSTFVHALVLVTAGVFGGMLGFALFLVGLFTVINN